MDLGGAMGKITKILDKWFYYKGEGDTSYEHDKGHAHSQIISTIVSELEGLKNKKTDVYNSRYGITRKEYFYDAHDKKLIDECIAVIKGL